MTGPRHNATITNSTFIGNKARVSGGGISVDDGDTLTVTNSTISGNTAGWVAVSLAPAPRLTGA